MRIVPKCASASARARARSGSSPANCAFALNSHTGCSSTAPSGRQIPAPSTTFACGGSASSRGQSRHHWQSPSRRRWPTPRPWSPVAVKWRHPLDALSGPRSTDARWTDTPPAAASLTIRPRSSNALPRTQRRGIGRMLLHAPSHGGRSFGQKIYFLPFYSPADAPVPPWPRMAPGAARSSPEPVLHSLLREFPRPASSSAFLLCQCPARQSRSPPEDVAIGPDYKPLRRLAAITCDRPLSPPSDFDAVPGHCHRTSQPTAIAA